MRTERDSGIQAGRPSKTQYEVGYGWPPMASRFKPGQSGNLKGRPKGARNRNPRDRGDAELNDIILREAYRTIRVQDGGRTRRLPIAQAVMRSIGVAAVKGQPRAQRLFTDLYRRAEAEQRQRSDEYFDELVTFKARLEAELKRREREGLPIDDLVPHPDHVIIDVRTGTGTIKGPVTKEEKVLWDSYRDKRAYALEGIAELETMLAETRDPGEREQLTRRLEENKNFVRIVSEWLDVESELV